MNWTRPDCTPIIALAPRAGLQLLGQVLDASCGKSGGLGPIERRGTRLRRRPPARPAGMAAHIAGRHSSFAGGLSGMNAQFAPDACEAIRAR